MRVHWIDSVPEEMGSIRGPKLNFTSGIVLGKLHHAAFDSFIIGVGPDYTVHVWQDVLDETDGPILRYGLQQLHDSRLIVPSANDQWPDREALQWRFEQFKRAA